MASERDELLSKPNAGDEEFTTPFTRSSCSYENLSDKFRVDQRDYKRQYAHIYYARLTQMTPLVQEAAKKKWGDVPCRKLTELKMRERCCVIGTFFKKMDLKPSVLKQISESHHVPPQPPRAKYVGSNDELLLEDQTQRLTMCGSVPSNDMVTGVVAALLGKELRNGSFEVEDYCFAGLPEQDDSATMETDEEDKYVVLVSGLNLGSSWCDQLSVEMFVDYVTGQLGTPADQRFCSNIVRVIVAGDSVSDKPAKSATAKDTKTRFLSRNYTAETIEGMKELDDVLTQLASCVQVDLMPGAHDPTNHQLPQQPLHRCLFPQANRYSALKGVTNPYQAKIGRMLFLGTSGQNVDDIFRFSTMSERLQILEDTLQMRHLAPTLPDTLACYPYSNEDPFIIEKCPHVYFCGNQPQFHHKKMQGEDGQTVLLINVPNFDLTHSCVLVNIHTLECNELTFSTSLDHKPNPELERLAQSLSQMDTPSQPETSLLHHMESDEED